MTNFVQEGKVLDAIAPTGGVVSGQLLAMSQMVGVAMTSAAAGLPFAFVVSGVVSVPKATGVTFAQGDKLYFDGTALNITNVTTNNILAGFAATPQASGDVTVNLLLLRS